MKRLLIAIVITGLAALATGGCGESESASATASSTGLPQGSEPAELDSGGVHDRDRQSLLADGSRQPVDLPGDRRGGVELKVVVTVTDRT